MLHNLRDIKKTNSKKYEDVGETLLRQNFSKCIELIYPEFPVCSNKDMDNEDFIEENKFCMVSSQRCNFHQR
jgi:hypothetical protein